ncbi:unnamed protein product [Closterium sp. NIES-53]
MGAAPAGSMGCTGHGMQSSGFMRRDRVEVVEQRTYGQDGGTQRSVQIPRPSTIPTLFNPSPREYTEEDKDRLSRKMVGAAVDKAFTTTPFDGTNFREWALRFRMNARVTNLWEFFMTLQYPVTMAEGNMRDAMERLENLQADYSQRATLAFWVLLHSVSATIQLQLDVFQKSYSSAFEAWEYLMETYQAKDSVAKASLQKQLDNLKMGSQERVEEYFNRATAIRDKLALAGKMVDEDSFTLNLITGLPPHWEELRHSAMLHDISDSYTLQRMMIQEQRYQDLISKTNRDNRPPRMAGQAPPPATADVLTRSQWLSHDATARLAIRNHLPATECAHFGEHRTAQALYDAVVARYSSPATAAIGRLLLPYLFPELSAFATVADLVTHLRTSDARYRATVPAEFLPTNQPPMFITLYFIVTRLPSSLRSVRDHFLTLDPTSLTVALLEQHLLAGETSAVAVGAARGTPRSPFFEGCSPSPLSSSFASAAATADVSVPEDLGAASTSTKRRNSKGKGGRGSGGGSGGGGGGSGSSSGGSGRGGGGGGGGGTSGDGGGSGGGGGGSGGSGGSVGGGTSGGRSGPLRGGPGGGRGRQ